MVKLLYLTHRCDPNWYYHFGQRGPESYGRKQYTIFPKALKLEPHHV